MSSDSDRFSKKYNWQIEATTDEIETIVRLMGENGCNNFGFMKVREEKK